MKGDKRRARAALNALRWLAMPTRPGSVEELDALIAEDEVGRQLELFSDAEGVLIRGPEADEKRVSPAEAGKMLLEGRIKPTSVRVKKNMTDRLFATSVRAAETSTLSELQAQERLDELGEEEQDSNGETWALLDVIGSMREAVPASLQAIVFAVAAAEAQANEWGQWRGQDDFAPVEDKCKRLARESGGVLALGEPPGQWFIEAVTTRHGIVHSRPGETETRSIFVDGPPSQALQARRACSGVRHVLLTLARLRGVPLPEYLKLSPKDPEDLESWRNAVVTSGLREDPDFPPLR